MTAALVTGANRGLGHSLVRELRTRGLAPVVGTYRDPGSSEALVALSREDPDVVAVQLDVTSDDSVAAAARQVAGITRSLRVVVNNAGVGVPGGSILTLPFDELRRQIEIHAFGPLRVVRALLPLLNEHSVVGNISSVVAGMHRMSREYAGYAQAKALQNAITLALAGSLRERGVTLLAFHPGWVATDMGGTGAPVSPAASARGIVDQLLASRLSDSGSFRDHLGRSLRW